MCKSRQEVFDDLLGQGCVEHEDWQVLQLAGDVGSGVEQDGRFGAAGCVCAFAGLEASGVCFGAFQEFGECAPDAGASREGCVDGGGGQGALAHFAGHACPDVWFDLSAPFEFGGFAAILGCQAGSAHLGLADQAIEGRFLKCGLGQE